MDGLRGAGAYGALSNANRADGSVSILRRAGEAAKPEKSELAVDGAPGGEDGDAAAADAPRPIGNVGQHLDLRI